MEKIITGLCCGMMSIQAMDSPYRKKKGLYIYDAQTNVHTKVATFNNDESARDFMEYLYKFTQILKGVETNELFD